MYIVVHVYGGLLESVTPYACLPEAQEGIAKVVPAPCDCGDAGLCQSYQEAYIYQASYLGKEGDRIESRHTPSKSS